MTIDKICEAMIYNEKVNFSVGIGKDIISEISAIIKDKNGSYACFDDNDNEYSLGAVSIYNKDNTDYWLEAMKDSDNYIAYNYYTDKKMFALWNRTQNIIFEVAENPEDLTLDGFDDYCESGNTVYIIDVAKNTLTKIA